jgi:hypothetical protein
VNVGHLIEGIALEVSRKLTTGDKTDRAIVVGKINKGRACHR